MPVHTFTLILDRRPSDEELATLFDTGCDDVTFGVEDGLPVADFDRSAPMAADAIASAVRDLDSIGVTARRLLDQDLLTLADIADRIGRSREAVRRYAAGTRGPGGFPAPVNPAREGTVFYRWSEVAPWLRDHLDIDLPKVDLVFVVANLVLQTRLHREHVPHMSALTDLLSV
ncbi:helix-turn-helix transcriptional regulator [Phytohabitans rumicis]|uniref:DNA-binding protein n=1 Tax=Phytohabitans rumicis TaxID=1076125 RepID=A0A6V8LBG0_9ACTN|nr:hypothetical protein [Phytohabitans rumicis]GFJ91397.1 hypothetical protein Prum_050390 [Phytohabitans rumicis]